MPGSKQSIQDDPEVQCIRRAQRGDHQAFELLVERYQRRVFSLVSRLVRQRDAVEDLVQEVFLKVYLAIRNYNFEAAFGTWLARVTVNHCYDYLRRQRASRVTYYSEMSAEAEKAVQDRAENPSGGGVEVERQTTARDLAEKLLWRAPTDDRVILGLKELEELSVEEIADLLNLKQSTVKVRLHRARKRMLEDLRRWQQGG